MATLFELQTALSLEDAYLLLEILDVGFYNDHIGAHDGQTSS